MRAIFYSFSIFFLTLSCKKNASQSTMAHFVVTAKDSGSPPRQASVPVLIRFEDVEGITSGYPRELVGESSNVLMVIILCSVSSVFILIIICLGIIICKTKGTLKSLTPTLTNSDTDSIYLQQHSGQYPSQVHRVWFRFFRFLDFF